MFSISNIHINLFLVIFVTVIYTNVEARNLEKRLIAPDSNVENLESVNNQLQHSDYDEYPMVVPKRAAILLDRLMVALHHALEDEKDGSRKISDVYGSSRTIPNGPGNPQVILPDYKNDFDKGRYDIYSENSASDMEVKDLKQDNRVIGESLIGTRFQRRAQEDDGSGRNNGRVYWRCYFNAVTCF